MLSVRNDSSAVMTLRVVSWLMMRRVMIAAVVGG